MATGKSPLDYSSLQDLQEQYAHDDDAPKPAGDRKRSPKARRRYAKKRRNLPTNPGCGIGARRNKSFSW